LDVFFSILFNTILPTLLVAGAGWVMARTIKPDMRSLSQVILYACAPCLIFQQLAASTMPLIEFGKIALFSVIVMSISAVLARLLALVLHLPHMMTATLMLMIMFTNVGNFGLPVVTLAFGQQALTYATIYFIITNLLLYTLGTLIASSGHESPRRALVRVLRLPVIYAVLLAGLVQLLRIQIPAPIATGIDMLARATIPAMLVVLGMQLSSAGFKLTRVVVWGTVIRLIAVPALAWFAAQWIGLSGAALQAGMLESATPSGVVASVFAVEYDIEPEVAANMVLVTTLVSPFTVTLLILLLSR
jgi:predicted permease